MKAILTMQCVWFLTPMAMGMMAMRTTSQVTVWLRPPPMFTLIRRKCTVTASLTPMAITMATNS
jgi:hypothetical protein